MYGHNGMDSMKVTFTFASGIDLAKVDNLDIYRTYFVFPTEILHLSDVENQILQIAQSIDLATRAYLFVSCNELNWKNLLIQHPHSTDKRTNIDFATGGSIQFRNNSARKKRDRHKLLKILGGGFVRDVLAGRKLAEDILHLLKIDGNSWYIYKVNLSIRDNGVVNMFNRRVSAHIKAEKKRERQAAKKAKLEAESVKKAGLEAEAKLPKIGRIYFIQQGENGAIKIGYTTNPPKRLKALATASPYPLHVRLVIEGSKKLEKDLHNKFAQWQLDGEWFEPCQEIIDFIETHN
jgi:hypothetical protein